MTDEALHLVTARCGAMEVFAEAALSGSGSAGGDRSARALGEAVQSHCGG